MNPIVLFILVLLVVIFSISTLILWLLEILKRHPSTAPLFESDTEMTRSSASQRQLRYLFNLHDSGLHQAFIDALPVFAYKEIIGLREPFDCAICLCEFSQQDKLRLLPLCSHAFHINCIDQWLLSNSTCPICRGTLHIENPVFEDQREEDVERQVFSVRLGKFKSSNEDGVVTREGETSSSDLGARRCYSMGSYKYIEADLEMQVALCPRRRNASNKLGIEERKMSLVSRGESFSTSKIWLWSEKDKFPCSSNFQLT